MQLDTCIAVHVLLLISNIMKGVVPATLPMFSNIFQLAISHVFHRENKYICILIHTPMYLEKYIQKYDKLKSMSSICN